MRLYIILFVFFLIGVYLWKSMRFSPRFDPIIFSNEKYSDYREQIAKKMNDKAQELSETPVILGNCDYTSPSDVEIAMVDLNDDRIPEVLALIGSEYYTTGVGGIQLEIYSQNQGGLQPIVSVTGLLNNKPTRFFGSGVQTSRYLAKSSHKTNGYSDLCWFIEALDPQKDRKHFLVWRSGSYDRGPSEKMTDDEKRLFEHENL
ncbi:MAG: hypothetical protein AB7F28_06705 [Candidatus Margulisiibacteriota bacterium]